MIHGTISGYNRGRCRCEECRSAASDYYRSRRALRLMLTGKPGSWRVSSMKSRRLVAKLRSKGWRVQDIATGAGLSLGTVMCLTAKPARGRGRLVLASTERRIAKLL